MANSNSIIDINIASRLLSLKQRKEEIKLEEKEIHSAIISLMKENNVDKTSFKIGNAEIAMEIIPEKEKEIFDTKKFKIENYELYVRFTKRQKNKEKIKIEIKEN